MSAKKKITSKKTTTKKSASKPKATKKIAISDIASPKETEKLLEERNVFLEAVLECTSNGIVACDQDGILSYFNRASREFHGLPSKAIPPDEWAKYYDLYEVDGKTPMKPESIPLFRALKGKEVSGQELVIAPKGLPARTLSVTGKMLVDSEGNRLGAVVSMNDITELKLLTEELAEHSDHLEAMVDQRTAELQQEITERRKVGETLIAQKEFTDTIIESVSHPLYVINVEDYKVVRMNSAAKHENMPENITCYELGHGLSKPCEGKEHECVIEKIRKTKKAVTVEHIHNIDGTKPTIVEVRGYPIFDSEGDVAQVVEYNLDITERKRVEKELKDSERKYRDIVNNAIVGVTITNLNADVLYVNNTLARILEYDSIDEIMQVKSFSVYKDPTERETAVKMLNEQGRIDNLELDLITKTGKVINTILSAVLKGDIITTVIVDITERKKMEEGLKESEEKYRRLVSSLQEGIWAIDKDETTIFVNDSMAEMLGYSVDEMIGKKPFDFMDEQGMKLCEYYIARRKQNIKEQHDFELIKKNGDRIYVTMEASPTYDESGNYVGGVTGVIDITERKKAEEKVMASLREKEVLLKEINHRVKNNMAVISSLLMLQASKIKDKQYKAIFKESTDRIKTMALIHEKLYESTDLAHIDFSAYLNDLLDAIYKSYGLPHNRVKMKKHIEKVMLSLDVAIPCALIVNELVSNSLKYAFPATPDRPEGRSGEVEVTFRMNDKDEVELRLGDNGVGMDEGMKSESKSIGLTIVNALVRQIRGNLEMGREKGTEFVITFRRPEK